MTLRFLLNDTPEQLADPAPEDMLLDHLRLARRLTGTKEGCAEGDCGACTVLVGRLDKGRVRYAPVNACIRPVISLHACHVVTVDHLDTLHGGLSPVQQTMVTEHASQCGFCTPGIVMSLTGHLMNGGAQTPDALRTAMDGNLCRCTGYRPILDAAAMVDPAMVDGTGADGANPLAARADETAATLQQMADTDAPMRPASVPDLLDLLAAAPDTRIIAGATDVGLWVTKRLATLAPAVVIDHLDDLQTIEDDGDALTLGACVTLARAHGPLTARLPHLGPYLDRFAGPQIRATGTVGGNIANGSPIGDLPPALIALDARLTLRSAAGRREIPLDAFFIDYGKQDLRPAEIVERITIPAQPATALHLAEKLSKRPREDISAVAMGLRLTFDGGRIASARLAYGGMAATPKRAPTAEAALTGAPWSVETARAAAAALAQDFAPISDMRASATYRLRAAGNLLIRAAQEQQP